MTIDNLQTSAIIELTISVEEHHKRSSSILLRITTGGQLFTESASSSAEQAQQMVPPVFDRTYSATFGGLQNRNDLVRLRRYKTNSIRCKQKEDLHLCSGSHFEKYAGDIEQLPKDVAIYLTAKISYKDSLGQVANCDVFPVTS